MSRTATVPLAPDPALPARDLLLDADQVRHHVGRLLARGAPVDVRACEIVRIKYRLGDSLRVVYRLELPDGPRTVSVRAFADPAVARRAAFAAPSTVAEVDRTLVATVHDVELGAVWWTFPHDRRVAGIPRLLRPVGALTDLPGGRWERSVVMEYAAERSATVRAETAGGRVLGFAKAYRNPLDAVAAAELHTGLAVALAGCRAEVRTPAVLAVDAVSGIVVLEAMPGTRWDELDRHGLEHLLPLLGRGVAHLHASPVPPGRPLFRRFQPGPIRTSCRIIAEARPELVAVAERLAHHLAAGPDDGGDDGGATPAVLLHGDLHPKNALADGDRLSLIDLDQAGPGPAAADLGGLLARLHHDELVGLHRPADARRLREAVLASYGSVRTLPSTSSLRWHVAAALVVERGVRAVNRVNRRTLAVLPGIMTLAERCLDGDAW